MFALEVLFKDGSNPTTIFVRRPTAIIGSSSFANVVLEDMKSLNFQLRLSRNIGRSFALSFLSDGGQLETADLPSGIEGVFEGHKQFDLGPVKIEITALDSDFILKESEAPDKAGVRVLRLATTAASSRFPAVVCGSPPVIISFNPDAPLIIGRSRACALRIESADVSSRHARVGFDGTAFWVEDLGSTNGTFVRGARVAGKTKVAAGESIMIARDCAVVGVNSEVELKRLLGGGVEKYEDKSFTNAAPAGYPAIISLSQVAKPSRIALVPNFSTKIGREPSSDMWLGAPHISRHHCTVFLTDQGIVKIIDQSTNGTEYDGGRLEQGKTLISEGNPHVLNFGAGITVGLCFSAEQERQFTKAKGAVASFGKQEVEHTEAVENKNLEQVKISDVSKLIGRRGRQATAHHLKAIYTSGDKKTQLMFWVVMFALLVASAVAIALIATILF